MVVIETLLFYVLTKASSIIAIKQERKSIKCELAWKTGGFSLFYVFDFLVQLKFKLGSKATKLNHFSFDLTNLFPMKTFQSHYFIFTSVFAMFCPKNHQRASICFLFDIKTNFTQKMIIRVRNRVFFCKKSFKANKRHTLKIIFHAQTTKIWHKI